MRSFQIRPPRETPAFLAHLVRAPGNFQHAAENAFREGDVAASVFLNKAATAAATGVPTWAEEASGLRVINTELVESAANQTVLGALDCRRAPLRTRVISAGGCASAWIGEGGAVPASALSLDAETLAPRTLHAMIIITKELIATGGPRLEQWCTRELVSAIARETDAAFCDASNAGVSGVKPASVTSGAVTINATGGLDTSAGIEALKGDLRKLLTSYTGDWDHAVLVAPTRLAVAAQLAGIPLLAPNSESTIRVLTSGGYPSDGGSPDTDSCFLLDTSSIVAGDGEVVLDSTDQGDLVLGNDPMSATGPTAANVVSLWQSGAVALKARFTINWSQPPAGRAVVLSGIPRS